MKTRERWLPAALLLCVSACGTGASSDAAQQNDEAARAITQASQAYAAAWRNNDAGAAAALLADDAVVSVPQQPDLRGRPAALAAWSEMLATTRVTMLDVRAEAITVSGDLAMEAGDYDETLAQGQNPPMNLNGRYVTVWQRQADGAWKILRFAVLDRPTSSPPAPQQ